MKIYLKKYHPLIFLFVIGIFSLIPLATLAQTITGKVIDEHTEEPLPFTNVFVPNSTTGTTTDIDGNFSITLTKKTDSLSVSAIGYQQMTKALNGNDQEIYFKLKRADYELGEVVISAGENPANILFRKIIKNKSKHNKERFENYSCEVYNKLEIDLDNISDKFREKKLFKPFDFIFENIDSVSEEKPFLPMFITETISDVYYRKTPKKRQEHIKATKVSGVENESITQFLGSMYNDINIYDNWIPVLGKKFASPISKTGLANYEYYIIDSNFIEGIKSFKMKFKPKRKQENTFFGEFWVEDSTYAVQRISMQMAEDVNVNFVERLSVYQDFVQKDSIWILNKDKLIIDFLSNKDDATGIIGRKTTTYKDYKVNLDDLNQSFDGEEDVIVSDSAYEKGRNYWSEARHEELSENEALIYQMVDSIKNVPVFKTYVDVVNTVVSGYYSKGWFEFGPYFKLLSYNDYEGFRIRAGFRTSNDFSERLMFGLYGAYGFKDEAFKYGAHGEYLLNKKPWSKIGASFMNDLDIASTGQEDQSQDNFLSGLYRKNIPQKLIKMQQYDAFYLRDWKYGFSNEISIKHASYDPVFAEVDSTRAFLFKPNDSAPAIEQFSTAEIKLKTRFAYKEKFVSGKQTRISLGTKFPIVEVEYTLGLKGLLGSDFNYQRIDVTVNDNVTFNLIGWLNYQVKAGKVFGTLPFLLLESHPGNETYFYNTHSFNLMNDYEFVSDQYVSLYMTHHFDGLILNKIPLMRKLKWRSLAQFKAVWGTMSNDNKTANALNTVNADPYIPIKSPDKLPYMEAGVGIENIFKLFRVDVIWRLNYHENPNATKIGVRGGLQLSF